MTDTTTSTNTNVPSKEFNLWHAYSVCLLVSFIFFLLFGFNSPLYKFNSDPDYNLFMTMGNGLINGKVPYRDLFDHRGPIVYFIYGFCCLFPTPRLIMLCLEILSMSLFFFFAYRIAKKFLNNFSSLLTLPVLAFIVFASWNRVTNASCIEEFCLPILTYFLFCWIEYILDKNQWHWIRSICLGICFGIIFWSKATILCFVLPLLLIWFIKNLKQRQFQTTFKSIFFMLIGILIITTPIIIYYGVNHAFDNLCYVYFYMNIKLMFGYKFELISLIKIFNSFIQFNPILTALLSYGLGRFIFNNWKKLRVLVISFLSTFITMLLTHYKNNYYFNILIPYTILSVIEIFKVINSKLQINTYKIRTYFIFFISCVVLVLPISILPIEITCKRSDYTPLIIADIIKNYELEHQKKATVFCYKISDLGIYNMCNTTPNNYYFSKYIFEQKQYPDIYSEYEDSIIKKTSEIVITTRDIWYKENILFENYIPITGHTKSSSFYYMQNYSASVYLLTILVRKGEN